MVQILSCFEALVKFFIIKNIWIFNFNKLNFKNNKGRYKQITFIHLLDWNIEFIFIKMVILKFNIVIIYIFYLYLHKFILNKIWN